jgi:AcrR family transcriptional regulator
MPTPRPLSDHRDTGDTRSLIIAAAAELIAADGNDAATMRAVATAAGVQVPTIYRLFGDKDSLLDAVAERTLFDYIAGKSRREPAADAIQDLRDEWDAHIAFGLANPSVFALISSAAASGQLSPASAAGLAMLRNQVRRVAHTGRLRVSQERAVDLIQAMGTGTVLTLLVKPPRERGDLADVACNAVFAAIINGMGPSVGPGPAGAASALRAGLADIANVTLGERHLLDELLQRIASAN